QGPAWMPEAARRFPLPVGFAAQRPGQGPPACSAGSGRAIGPHLVRRRLPVASGVMLPPVKTAPRPLPRSLPARASWLELDASALAHTLGLFRSVLGEGVRLGAVLKGNAYGHGFAQVLPVVHPLADLLYVIDPRDALAI